VKVNIRWLDAEMFEHDNQDEIAAKLEPLHGILVPGGFGERGSEGKIAGVKFARERNVPFFGICLGMQMACIEGARNRGRRQRLHHRIRPDPRAGGRHDHRMDDAEGLQKREEGGDLGGTMRLGAYPAKLGGNSVSSIYGSDDDQRAPSPPL
jgi:CTP synthase